MRHPRHYRVVRDETAGVVGEVVLVSQVGCPNDALGALPGHCERLVDELRGLHLDPEYSRRVARGAVGLTLRVTCVDARAKLSQNSPPSH